MATRITFTESVDNAGRKLAVDSENGVIRGVKIIGLKSLNGREYLQEAINKALPLYEGSKVNIDHITDPKARRPYKDRFGYLENVKPDTQDGGAVGDLKFNPKHALAEQVIWDATHRPENFGLSHNVEGTSVTRDGKTIVDQINKVHSVDLVADPATTKSLFESENMPAKTLKQLAESLTSATLKAGMLKLFEDDMPAAGMADQSAAPVMAAPDDGDGDDDKVEAAFQAMVMSVVCDDSLDTAGKLAKIKLILTSKDKIQGNDKPAEPPADSPAEESKKESAAAIGKLQEELKQLKAEKSVRSLVESCKVEATDVQIEAAIALPEAKRKAFIESLAKKTDKQGFRPGARSSGPIREGDDTKKTGFDPAKHAALTARK